MNKKTAALILMLGVCCLVFHSCAGGNRVREDKRNRFNAETMAKVKRVKGGCQANGT